MSSSMIRGGVAVAAIGAALAVPAAAGAHVTIQPEELQGGGFARMDVRVPNERDKADTTKVQVQFPSGFYFLNYEPKSGWTVKVRREKLAKPVEVFGEKQTEQIRDVTITSDRGKSGIAPGQFEDFGLSGGPVPGKAGAELTFKALQTYGNGEVVRWIAADPEAETPAARVKIVPSAEAEAAAAEEGDDDGASKGLAIAGLVVGGLGLLVALVALAAARRRAATTA